MPAVGTAPLAEVGYASGSAWWNTVEAEQTPELRWPLNLRVFDAMRSQDAQATSVLRAVALPVRRTRWSLDPAGCRPEVVQHVATDLGLPVMGQPGVNALRTRGRFSWSEHLALALLEIVYGHMFFEQVYRLDQNGFARLRKLAPRMPRTLSAINVAPDGGLVSIEQSGTSQPIPVTRLVAYVHDREGGDWLGRSLLRPAYKHWLLKDRLIRVQSQTIERNGMGVPTFTGQDGATDDDITAGLNLTQSLRAGDTSGVALRPGQDLELKGMSGTLPDASPAIKYHDEQIARAVLAHFLNLNAQGGSYALAAVQADTFTQSLQTLAQQICDTAQAHVIEDIVDINYGETEPAPRLVFEEIGSRQAATAQALKMLVDAGLLFPDRPLEEALRQQHGLPAKQTDTGGTAA